MMLAKNTSAARRLSEQIRNQTMQKSYQALVCGSAPPNGVLTHYLKKNPSTNFVTAVSTRDTNAKYAELAYQRIDNKKNLSLLDIHLQTGRSHQIRVQLSTEGYPIWGDQKYGDASCGDPNRPIALFAYRLGFTHPQTGQAMTLEAPPPTTYPWNLFGENSPR
jgi:23S rRNA pseudouridine1911/1915/1917 synthase